MRVFGDTALSAAGPSPHLREGVGAGTPPHGGAPAPAGLASGGPLHPAARFRPPPLPKGPLHWRENACSASQTSAFAHTGIYPGSAPIHRNPPGHAHGASASIWKPCSRARNPLAGFGRIGSAAGHPVRRRKAVPSYTSRPPWPRTNFASGLPMTVCSGPWAFTAPRTSTHDP